MSWRAFININKHEGGHRKEGLVKESLWAYLLILLHQKDLEVLVPEKNDVKSAGGRVQCVDLARDCVFWVFLSFIAVEEEPA